MTGKRVLCYAPAEATGWVFVDCWDEAPRRYVPGAGSFNPGWWLHHPGHETTEETAAIAAQLRQIEDDDPSQGRRRSAE